MPIVDSMPIPGGLVPSLHDSRFLGERLYLPW